MSAISSSDFDIWLGVDKTVLWAALGVLVVIYIVTKYLGILTEYKSQKEQQNKYDNLFNSRDALRGAIASALARGERSEADGLASELKRVDKDIDVFESTHFASYFSHSKTRKDTLL